MRTSVTAFVVALGILGSACGDRALNAPAAERVERVAFTAAASSPAPAMVVDVVNRAPAPATQMLIRSADLHIQVSSVERALHDLDSLMSAKGALVADSRRSQDARGGRNAEVILHVPEARFNEALAGLRLLGDVKSEVVNTQDITRSYADLETRLAVKEGTVNRLRALLANNTAKLSDVLEVERELSRAVTELEQMKGERRFDEQQVAMSSITAQFFERDIVKANGFFAATQDAFGKAIEAFGMSIASVVYVATFLIPWLAFAAFAWWIVRRIRRRDAGGIQPAAGVAS